MATGRLGTANLVAGTLTTLYTVPTDTFAVISVSFVNRGSTLLTVRLAAAATDTPTDDEFLEFDTELFGKGVLERTGIILGAGQKIVARSSAAGVSAVVFGIETPTA